MSQAIHDRLQIRARLQWLKISGIAPLAVIGAAGGSASAALALDDQGFLELVLPLVSDYRTQVDWVSQLDHLTRDWESRLGLRNVDFNEGNYTWQGPAGKVMIHVGHGPTSFNPVAASLAGPDVRRASSRRTIPDAVAWVEEQVTQAGGGG